MYDNTDTVQSRRPTTTITTTGRRTSTGSTNSSCSSSVESEAVDDDIKEVESEALDDDIKAVVGGRQTRVVNQSKGLLFPLYDLY